MFLRYQIRKWQTFFKYFSFVLLLFLIQLMTGCMGYLYQETVRERAKISLRHTINATREDNSRAFVLWNTWNQMQTEVNLISLLNLTRYMILPLLVEMLWGQWARRLVLLSTLEGQEVCTGQLL